MMEDSDVPTDAEDSNPEEEDVGKEANDHLRPSVPPPTTPARLATPERYIETRLL